MATTTGVQKEDYPGKTLKQHEPSDPSPPHPIEAPDGNTSPDADAHPPKESGVDKESTVTAGDLTANDDNSGSATDTQKKIRRAERFGMPVQLSEQEKRNSRAERFGTGAGLHGSDAIKKSEEHKRKARAERFGLEQSVPAAEEEKKKARLARFAPVSQIDSVEEDKKKARALRFSETSSSLPQANGKGIEPKAAITGKAGGGA